MLGIIDLCELLSLELLHRRCVALLLLNILTNDNCVSGGTGTVAQHCCSVVDMVGSIHEQ